MTKKILTGVDNSETALRAAEKAAALAAALGAELHVLSSYTVNMTEAVRISHPEAYEKVVSQYAENAGAHRLNCGRSSAPRRRTAGRSARRLAKAHRPPPCCVRPMRSAPT